MITIKYDWRTADENGYAGIHPQRVVESLRCNVLKYEDAAMAGCSYMQINKLPNPLPVFIKETADCKF